MSKIIALTLRAFSSSVIIDVLLLSIIEINQKLEINTKFILTIIINVLIYIYHATFIYLKKEN
jgi:hypothetical protein